MYLISIRLRSVIHETVSAESIKSSIYKVVELFKEKTSDFRATRTPIRAAQRKRFYRFKHFFILLFPVEVCARQAIREWFQNGFFWLQYVEIYACNRFYLTFFKSFILIMHSVNKIQTFVKTYPYFNCLILLWSSNFSIYSYIYI